MRGHGEPVYCNGKGMDVGGYKFEKIFAASVIMGILSVLLSFCARKVTGFAQTYSVTVYPVLRGIFARISGIFPFSVSEAGLYFCYVLSCFVSSGGLKAIVSVKWGLFHSCSLIFPVYSQLRH